MSHWLLSNKLLSNSSQTTMKTASNPIHCWVCDIQCHVYQILTKHTWSKSIRAEPQYFTWAVSHLAFLRSTSTAKSFSNSSSSKSSSTCNEHTQCFESLCRHPVSTLYSTLGGDKEITDYWAPTTSHQTQTLEKHNLKINHGHQLPKIRPTFSFTTLQVTTLDSFFLSYKEQSEIRVIWQGRDWPSKISAKLIWAEGKNDPHNKKSYRPANLFLVHR